MRIKMRVRLRMSEKNSNFDLLPLVFNRGPFECYVRSMQTIRKGWVSFCQYYVLRLMFVYMPHSCEHMRPIVVHKT